MQQQHRQLAAILFTDIVGYTALMQENEQQAVAMIKHYNTALNQLVGVHNGRVLNYYGDGSLCSFFSVTEALNCAIALQKELQSEPPVPLRIGLHVGEVFFEEEKALGDGVNVASRIQSLGQANSILFSKEIFDKVRNQPEFKSISLGLFEFKNVQEPLEVFALANQGLHIPQKKTLEGKLKVGGPNKGKSHRTKIVFAIVAILLLVTALLIYSKYFPQAGFTGKEKSIAVLPFTNMSNEKDNEYFSDGITEEITNQLAKIAELKVIARTSSMLYKGSKKSIKEIAEELGVASVLQGSIQKSGNAIRISAQLIDANTQKNLWTDKYDRELKEVFAIQSEVSQKIASQLRAKLSNDEKSNIERTPTDNPQAYVYYLQGKQLLDKFTQTTKKEYFDNSKLMFEKAIVLDTNYALAHAGLASLYSNYTDFVTRDTLLIRLQLLEIEKAYSLSPDLEFVNSTRGAILRTALDSLEESFNSFLRAYSINPNNSSILFEFGLLLSDLGLFDDRITLLQKAANLDPLNSGYFGFLGGAKVHINRLEDGLQDLQAALRLEPDMYYVIDRIAYVYALQNNLTEMDAWLKKFLNKIPKEQEENFNEGYGQYAAYCFAKLGNKKKALEISKNWRVYLALGMKEEALRGIIEDDAAQKIPFRNDYQIFKAHLPHKDFDLIRNDPRFLELMEKKRMQYEINKKKFSIAGLLNENSSPQ